MENKFVLFIYTAPSDKVPHKLYYINGKIWSDDLTDAWIFNSMDAVYQKQQELKNYDAQILRLKEE